jgi:asparagine synthase (glutamine-hydrolysing)
MRSIEDAGVAGIAIEAGCALGGSAIVIASAKSPTRPMFVFDTFEGIPPPSDEDGDDVRERYAVISSGRAEGLADGDVYYGYHENLFDEVRNNFATEGVPTDENRVTLVRGLFQDTMKIAESVAFVHLDSDWYESTMTALQRIWPHVSVGGVVVIDDYDAWSGCRRAVDEYFADRDDYRIDRHLRPHLVRTREQE